MGKWTKGPFVLTGSDNMEVVGSLHIVQSVDGYPVSFIPTWEDDAAADEARANAALVAEAFNTAHETGLTPRQLAEQRAELLGQALEALEAARIELENEGAWVPTKVTAVLELAGKEK